MITNSGASHLRACTSCWQRYLDSEISSCGPVAILYQQLLLYVGWHPKISLKLNCIQPTQLLQWQFSRGRASYPISRLLDLDAWFEKGQRARCVAAIMWRVRASE